MKWKMELIHGNEHSAVAEALRRIAEQLEQMNDGRKGCNPGDYEPSYCVTHDQRFPCDGG